MVVSTLAFLQAQPIKETIAMKKDLNQFYKKLFQNKYEPVAQLLLDNSAGSWKFNNNKRGWESWDIFQKLYQSQVFVYNLKYMEEIMIFPG